MRMLIWEAPASGGANQPWSIAPASWPSSTMPNRASSKSILKATAACWRPARPISWSTCARITNGPPDTPPAPCTSVRESSSAISKPACPTKTRAWCSTAVADIGPRWPPTICKKWATQMPSRSTAVGKPGGRRACRSNDDHKPCGHPALRAPSGLDRLAGAEPFLIRRRVAAHRQERFPHPVGHLRRSSRSSPLLRLDRRAQASREPASLAAKIHAAQVPEHLVEDQSRKSPGPDRRRPHASRGSRTREARPAGRPLGVCLRFARTCRRPRGSRSRPQSQRPRQKVLRHAGSRQSLRGSLPDSDSQARRNTFPAHSGIRRHARPPREGAPVSRRRLTLAVVLLVVCPLYGDDDDRAVVLPTGKQVTPSAAPGAQFVPLNPGLPGYAGFVAGQAMSTAVSPDSHTLLILTSGYNVLRGPGGKKVPDASREYVFVYDIGRHPPAQTQVLQVANTFAGICFSPSGKEFYVSGGKDDNVHTFTLAPGGQWRETGEPIPLGHQSGLGLSIGKESISTGGIAVTADGNTLLVANLYNDSVSMIDLPTRKVAAELDLRPGKTRKSQAGVPGGEYPFWVAVKGNSTAYVSSLRDREIVVLQLGRRPSVRRRIKMHGSPNKMILNGAQSRLYVTADNTDTVTVIDTATDRIVETIPTTAPAGVLENPTRYTGSAPNSAALSPDERTLYVTNGGTNSLAIVRLGGRRAPSTVAGLVPTGWYPNAVSVSGDGRTLYVVNGKSMPG